MRVKVLEERIKDSDENGNRYNVVQDDILTVPKDVGERWVGAGWAKDVDGKVETGARIVRNATLEPVKASHGSRSKSKGGR